ncbi:MAG: pilus assembly protein TadG, partial [Rhizobiaceae bacterium]|nr:pilus assembly protein TadG [Rhizobiaceae bacterium]
DSAKTAGIEIYTIAFMAPDRGRALLQYCATDTSHYFDAQNAADLVAAFKEIGEKATETMTRLTN